MSYSICYGRPPDAKTIRGLTTKDAVAEAHKLLDRRIQNFQIIDEHGEPVSLHSLELNLPPGISVYSV